MHSAKHKAMLKEHTHTQALFKGKVSQDTDARAAKNTENDAVQGIIQRKNMARANNSVHTIQHTYSNTIRCNIQVRQARLKCSKECSE